MKTSKIEQIVAEMTAELIVVDQCRAIVEAGGDLSVHRNLLVACIARLSGTEAPKPARTRKSRKATEPTI